MIAIKTGAIKATEANIMKEFGGNLELTEGWARNVLKNMDWMKSKRTTGEVNPCVKLLEEEKFLFQHSTYKFVS